MAIKTVVASGNTSVDISTNPGMLWGWSVTDDSAGQTALVEFRDGSGASGDTAPLAARLRFTATVLLSEFGFDDAVKMENGIRLTRSGGNSTVIVYWSGGSAGAG